ncbi:MAG: ATP-dependent helicase [Oscillospiraceae bacterium]
MTDKKLAGRFIAARRRFIEKDFMHLNEMQRKAVMATEGPLLLLAGAGSGKTTVLINRMANLLKYGRGSDTDEIPENINQDDVAFLESASKSLSPDDIMRAEKLSAVEPVQPWRIIAITFTNKAADELKARLETMLGPEASDIWAMTFHSACVRILRRDIDRLGYDRSFTIYDTSDSLSVIKRALKELDIDDKSFPPRMVLSQISKAKDLMMDAGDYLSLAEKNGDVHKKQIGRVYVEYLRRLKDAGALDFDDLILLTVRLLSEYEDVLEYYQKKFRYVLIDEYQDTNNLQYRLTSMLAGGYRNICVVGDDDQSIYRFRGATIENILNFEKQYKNARVIRLEQNYRSTGHILGASNAVIKNNVGRKGKELWTDKDMGEKLKLFAAESESDEAQYVAGQILAGFSAGKNWRDFAVLYRMNAQSNQLEYAFKRNAIPYRVIGGLRFFDRAEIKDILSYLCVINNPADDLRLLRIVNTPTRGIGPATLERAQNIAAAESRPLFGVLQDCRNYSDFQKSAPRLCLFTEIIDDLRSALEDTPLDLFYDLVLEKTGYLRALEVSGSDENLARIENISELKSNIISFIKDAENPTLSGFLDEVALYTDIEQYDADSDCALLMTMHSAKGLEFPTVFIVGAEDGIFPGLQSIGEPGEMEEERRLCYVAMTRAKEKLYLTCARRRMLFGRTTANQVSRFVGEIPDEHIEKPTPKKSYGFGSIGASGYGGRNYGASGTGRVPKPPKPYTIEEPPAPVASAANFKTGDSVRHRAFGNGVIKTLQPMGSDALIEIEFSGSTKRLMLKSAIQHMEKI